MTETLEFDFAETSPIPPAGSPNRFTDRWHFIGAGLSNVWRFGDLDLPAPTGRLLLRGPNGTGKTTALEAVWPYLLDLDAAKLNAGKARTTTLKQLMSEGAEKSGRRYGYAWLTFAPPTGADDPHCVTYGVRLQYSPSSSPAVKVVPFTVPAKPLQDFDLKNGNGSALEHDDFTGRINDLGGDVFESSEEYVEHLALRIWGTSTLQVKDIAQRMRQIRNPALLGEVSPSQAAEALRESLPGVAAEDINATADALAESETTREAFERDRQAAVAIRDFSRVWTGHLVEVANTHLAAARDAADTVARLTRALSRAETDARTTAEAADKSEQHAAELSAQLKAQANTVHAIEQSQAYQTAGRGKDLADRLNAERQNADSATATLTAEARAAAGKTEAAKIALDTAVDRLGGVLNDATESGADVPPVDTVFAYHHRPRQVHSIADATANPGSGLSVTHDAEALDKLATDWVTQARAWVAEAGVASSLVKAYGNVAHALDARTAAASALEASERQHQAEQTTLAALASKARDAASHLLEQVKPWLEQHHTLRAVDPDDPESGYAWDQEDVTALADAEPAAVLTNAQQWAEHATSTAERLAADHQQQAKAHTNRAGELTGEARNMRNKAQELRGGVLLPFPRPHWAGDGDDAAALGSVLEWQPGVDDADRDRIETALAASGLLTAHLDTSTAEASTVAWRVSAAGPEVEENLGQVLTVDASHSGAEAARTVLTRIRLAETTCAGTPGLMIGRDGTFAAGVLGGDPASAVEVRAESLPPAGFVGARTRRERALAEAERLEACAAGLEKEAEAELSAARQAQARSRTIRADGQSFPKRDQLRAGEAARAAAAIRTQDAKQARDEAERTADAAATEHQRVHDEWSGQARAARMPADVEQLGGIVTDRRTRAGSLNKCVTTLRSLTTTTLPRALTLLVDEDELAALLAGLETKARRTHEKANATAVLLDEVQRDPDAADALRRHQEAIEESARLTEALTPAQQAAAGDRLKAIEAAAKVEPAREALSTARPARTHTEHLLSSLLNWPPAFAALDVSSALAADGHDPQTGVGEGKRLLDLAAALLGGKPTSARRTLGERYDEVRAQLAQTWTLARGDSPAGLNVETYVLTHADEEYDPPRAAHKAGELAANAEAALAEAEAKALQDLVIGRLPTAIGIAWQKMHDWKNEVNAKMRSAQASSGVGVQVRVTLRDDLDAAASTVQKLSCEVSTAVRTDEQKKQVGDAIEALLAAADGDTMADRLAAAIDIRSWVDVRYLVERPDADGKRSAKVWGSRVGLSGGERRLVVLAPMLAAIAAAYDRLGASGLRLVPLDEVPAEVDERGREGLARYMADLDLDLICTSYLWDGAPGAWDGIDGHDLEAGSDGTVVAFPTLVRGLEAIPDDFIVAVAPVE